MQDWTNEGRQFAEAYGEATCRMQQCVCSPASTNPLTHPIGAFGGGVHYGSPYAMHQQAHAANQRYHRQVEDEIPQQRMLHKLSDHQAPGNETRGGGRPDAARGPSFPGALHSPRGRNGGYCATKCRAAQQLPEMRQPQKPQQLQHPCVTWSTLSDGPAALNVSTSTAPAVVPSTHSDADAQMSGAAPAGIPVAIAVRILVQHAH